MYSNLSSFNWALDNKCNRKLLTSLDSVSCFKLLGYAVLVDRSFEVGFNLRKCYLRCKQIWYSKGVAIIYQDLGQKSASTINSADLRVKRLCPCLYPLIPGSTFPSVILYVSIWLKYFVQNAEIRYRILTSSIHLRSPMHLLGRKVRIDCS